jgi:hypothetical protein
MPIRPLLMGPAASPDSLKGLTGTRRSSPWIPPPRPSLDRHRHRQGKVFHTVGFGTNGKLLFVARSSDWRSWRPSRDCLRASSAWRHASALCQPMLRDCCACVRAPPGLPELSRPGRLPYRPHPVGRPRGPTASAPREASLPSGQRRFAPPTRFAVLVDVVCEMLARRTGLPVRCPDTPAPFGPHTFDSRWGRPIPSNWAAPASHFQLPCPQNRSGSRRRFV